MLDTHLLLSAWTSAPLIAQTAPAMGTVHQTLLLTTLNTTYVLRAYRYTERQRIAYEHALITYADTQSIPVTKPLPTLAGETILEQAGRFYALFPFVPDRQVARGHLSKAEIAAMGSFLARLQRALYDYPHDRVRTQAFTYDPTPTLQRFAAVEAVIHARPAYTNEDRRILERMAREQDWLGQEDTTENADLSSLEQQVIHGDYQETNLFFVDNHVSMIIDWDQAYVAPRAWEIIRTLHLVFNFEPVACAIFLHAYRSEHTLAWEDLEIAAACYCTRRMCHIWIYEQLYIEKNERVRRFLNLDEDESPPLITYWNNLWAQIG